MLALWGLVSVETAQPTLLGSSAMRFVLEQLSRVHLLPFLAVSMFLCFLVHTRMMAIPYCLTSVNAAASPHSKLPPRTVLPLRVLSAAAT